MLMITSFNEILFQQYGERMVREFSENSDGSVKLLVVFEGINLPKMNLKNIEFICFDNDDHKLFIRKFGHFHEARGLRIKTLDNNKINLSMDYRYDAVRFSFKIFSLLQALNSYNPPDYFAWIDADIRCVRNFSASDLKNFFPFENELMSYLGRINFPPGGAYSECGFLGFNMRHPLLLEFLNRVALIYRDGELFSYEQWHDSWIWDQVRMEYERNDVNFKNISGAASSSDHPFINCELGLFFDHLKGPERKKLGKSFADDYKAK